MPYNAYNSGDATGRIRSGNQAALQAMLYMLTSSGGSAAGPTGGVPAGGGVDTNQAAAFNAGAGPVGADYAQSLYGLNGSNANPWATMMPASGAGQPLLQGGGYKPAPGGGGGSSY
jgi:hypothetical protein